jgi:manganese/zinc/iron transport system permease protein
MGFATASIIVFVLLFWKELKIASFDPGLATSVGINATLVHYLLMGMVAAFTVAAFEAVGSILVVAMLIVPSATAQLLSNRLSMVTVLSVLMGISSAVLGRWGALQLGTSVSGMMAVMAGAQLVFALILGPQSGLLARLLHQTRLGLRILREDLLAMLYRWQFHFADRPLPMETARAALGGGVLPWIALRQLLWRGMITKAVRSISLSEAGADQASKIIQGHRLWESYLAQHFDLPNDQLHEPADRMEHFIDKTLRQRIDRELKHPRLDPHGSPIPAMEKTSKG